MERKIKGREEKTGLSLSAFLTTTVDKVCSLLPVCRSILSKGSPCKQIIMHMQGNKSCMLVGEAPETASTKLRARAVQWSKYTAPQIRFEMMHFLSRINVSQDLEFPVNPVCASLCHTRMH